MAKALRPEIKAQLGSEATAIEIMKVIAARWRSLTETEKGPYQRQAAEAKERYKKEKEEWKAGPKLKPPRGYKQKKGPKRPKRPLTAYLYFGKAWREQAKQDVGFYDLPGVEGARRVTKRLAQMWSETSRSWSGRVGRPLFSLRACERE